MTPSKRRKQQSFADPPFFLPVLVFNLLGDGLRDALDLKIDRQ